MASQKNKSKRKKRTKSTKDAEPKHSMSEKELRKIEDDTLKKVNSSISSLEIAIATWHATKKKPKDLEPKYEKYIWLHKELSKWATRMLKSRKHGSGFDARIKLLGNFVKICSVYGEV